MSCYVQQVKDQRVQVENLKAALRKLAQKLVEAETRSEVLLVQHRRSKASNRASDAQAKAGGRSPLAAFERMKREVMRAEAVSRARAEMRAEDSVDERFAALEKAEVIDRLLEEGGPLQETEPLNGDLAVRPARRRPRVA